ncbi:MAG: HAD hydrolase-like protein [Bacteroidia bacterium]|nr:HAD hydrolase-like protein [Bacteroidia bacterium]
MDHQSVLRDLQPHHDYFIGIDSDGCVFDSMEVKQKEFFIPAALRYFNLFHVSKVIRETWEFVNLYSSFRGGNRFPAMVKVFELLSEREEIKKSGIKLPDLTSLKEWIKTETKLGNATLRKYYETNFDQSLEVVLRWSENVNREIGEWLHDIPPFFHAKKAMEEISGFADIIVVSQTPNEALEREWLENDLKKYVRMIAAQEHGTKAEHIALAAKGKYSDNRILLIGDAFGDLNAAKSNGVLFYPIIPGREDKSWERFLNEGLEKFVSGTFTEKYEESLISEFRKSLPEIPLWRTTH